MKYTKATIIFIMCLLTINAVAGSNKRTSDSILVSTTLSANMTVKLKKDTAGNYSGQLDFSTIRLDNHKRINGTKQLRPEETEMTLKRILAMDLLQLIGNDAKAIDGFRAVFAISGPQGDRKIIQTIGLTNNEESSKATQIIRAINQELLIHLRMTSFFNDLPAGTYSRGMTTVKVHQLLAADVPRSSLYQLSEQFFEKNRSNLPLYLIDKKIVEPTALNNYEVTDLTDVQLVSSAEAVVLYGSQAQNGAVLYSTKATKTKLGKK